MKHKDFNDRVFDFSTQMTAASLAIVGLLLVVTYEFQHANALAEANIWLSYVHLTIFATGAFSLSSFLGLIYKTSFLPEKYKKHVSGIMTIAFLIAWVILFIVLAFLFLQTGSF
jgi:hypothetical protein